MRTTVDIDQSVLEELRARQRAEGKTLGSLVSELLARALANDEPEADRPLRWTANDMGAKVDLEDPEALRAALDDR